MLKRAVSGQFLHFRLVSVLSGYAVTGFSGAISGNKIPDNSSRCLLSGNIVETSGGMYRANLYDWDVSGDCIGYDFTASGCIPVTFMVVTIDATSGHLFAASGTQVLVYSGQMSGQPETLLSGYSYPASGVYTVSTAAAPASGTLYLASGSIFLNTFASGVVGGGSGNLPSSWGGSGAVVVAVNQDKSGITVGAIASGILSGQQVTLTSGQSYLASGHSVVVPIASVSGLNAVVPAASISGVVANSGLFVSVPVSTLSGVQAASGLYTIIPLSTVSGIQTASGVTVTVVGGTLSGQVYPPPKYNFLVADSVTQKGTSNSGTIFLDSGSVPVDSWYVGDQVYLYGPNWGSGQIRTVVAYGGSGNQAALDRPWMLSGVPASGTSYVIFANNAIGLTSGQQVPVGGIGSGLLSGQLVTLVSGQSYPASGVNTTVPTVSISGTTVVVPVATISGTWPASGAAVVVPTATLSGVVANSGLFVSVPIASVSGLSAVVPPSTLSGVVANSGLFVSVPLASISGVNAAILSGILSGQQVTLTSGQSYTASGIFATATATIASGALSGQQVTLVSGQSFIASGINTVVPIASVSGVNVSIQSGQLSGQQVTLVSGQSYTASGIFAVSTAAAPASGTIYLASGHGFFFSGQLYLASGSLSGQLIGLTGPDSDISTQGMLTSGTASAVYLANTASTTDSFYNGQIIKLNTGAGAGQARTIIAYTGSTKQTSVDRAFQTAPDNTTTYSVMAADNPSVTASLMVNVTSIANPVSVASGTVYLASGHGLFMSGQIYPASGALSGQQVTLTSGQSYPASGIFVTATASVSSGSLYLASGSIFMNTFASGVVGGGSGSLPGAWGASGAVTVGQNLDKAGYGVTSVSSGLLSGQQVILTSGQSYTASGIFAVSTAAAPASGTTYLASGHGFFLSGQLFLASGALSGQQVTLTSGQSYTASGINATATATIASGALSGQQVTLTSGQSFVASGINSVVPPSSVSGVNATVPISTLSGVQPVSGATVSVPIASVSGLNAVVPVSTLSGIQPVSGATVTVPISSVSGVVPNVISGITYTASGIFATASVSIASGQVWVASGTLVSVYSGQLSGQPVTLLSGLSYTASGIWPASGAQVVATASPPASGTTYLASGHGFFFSGSLYLASGSLSGQQVTLTSGQSYPASGVFTASTAAAPASGTTYLASGSLVGLLSGQSVSVYSGQLSGQPVTLLSGFSYTASGINSAASLASGQIFIASGAWVVAGSVQDKSGYTLSASGADTVRIESGMNFRQALSVIAAALAGRLSGAGTNVILFDGANASGTNRITAHVDASGNRTSVILSLPT